MKYLLVAILALLPFSAALHAQTVTVNLAITVSAQVLTDINTHWLDQTSGSLGTLAAPVSLTDTTVTLSSAQPVVPGSAILVGREPMTVQSVAGAMLTVTRGEAQTTPTGATQFPTTVPATHDTGNEVFYLKYTSPWAMLSQEALLDWAQNITKQLGARSATFANSANGSVTQN